MILALILLSSIGRILYNLPLITNEILALSARKKLDQISHQNWKLLEIAIAYS